MKTVTRFIASMIFAVTALSGCEALLNTLVTDPLFTAGEVWYDGQTYQLVKVSACTYEFEDDSDYVTLKENSKGKMVATLKMPDDIFALGQESTVRITARNADEPEVEPYFVDVKLKPWKLAVYDKDNKVVDKMTVGNVYTIAMVTGLKSIAPVELSGGGLTVEDNPQNLTWDLGTSENILSSRQKASTSFKVAATAAGTGKVKATLGHRTVELTVQVVAN